MAAPLLPGPCTPVWKTLESHAARLSAVHTRELFQQDPAARFARFSCEAGGLLLDYSRQKLDAAAMDSLCELADAVALRDRIEAMWRGEAINATEGRAVLHVALRQPHGGAIGGADIEKAVLAERERMLDFAMQVRG